MQRDTPGRATSAASIFLIAIGVMVLVGWAFDVAILKVVAGDITMKANAAIGLLLCGLALRSLSHGSLESHRAGRACALAAALIGGLTLSEHIVGWNLGLDELVFIEGPGAAATASPGRMGPNGALGLTLGGLAIWCLFRSTARATAAAQVMAACVAVFALIPVVGYLYGAAQLYAISRYTGIALHTGVSLVILAAGILTARPGTGPVAALACDAPHGLMARRLLASSIVIPLLLGYLRLAGQRLGWYDTALGTSLYAVAMIVMFSLVIWRTATALERSDHARRVAQEHRDELLVLERAAREKAERADHAKDEFIATLSHELRTPLNAILGWMRMLQQGLLTGESRGKATDAVARNAGVLAHLIEDLLDTSRINTGHLELSLSPVDLKEVAQASVEAVMPAAQARRVEITVASGPPVPLVVGDAQRLQQVVWNLLSNAIKFSPEGGRVEVAVLAEGDKVRISVRDDGQGIEPAFLPHVFDRFRQADSSPTRGQGGLGLGLYIAQHLTALHGGTIHARSEGAGRGAVFEIELPAAAGMTV